MGSLSKKILGVIIGLILVLLGVYSYVWWGLGPLFTVIKGILGVVLILIGLMVGVIMFNE